MGLPVEARGLQEVAHLVDGLDVEQERPKKRALGLFIINGK
jgi:hypothetical protein